MRPVYVCAAPLLMVSGKNALIYCTLMPSCRTGTTSIIWLPILLLPLSSASSPLLRLTLLLQLFRSIAISGDRAVKQALISSYADICSCGSTSVRFGAETSASKLHRASTLYWPLSTSTEWINASSHLCPACLRLNV